MNKSLSFSTLMIAILMLIMTASCNPTDLNNHDQSIMEIRGHVLEIVPKNVSEFETLKVRAEDGQLYQFTSDTFTGFTPGHIKEHQLFGQTLLVRFISRDGILVAITLED